MQREPKCQYHDKRITQTCTKHFVQLCADCRKGHQGCFLISFESFQKIVLDKIAHYQKKIAATKRQLGRETNEQFSVVFRSLEAKIESFCQVLKQIWELEVQRSTSSLAAMRDEFNGLCDKYVKFLDKKKNTSSIFDLNEIKIADMFGRIQEDKARIAEEMQRFLAFYSGECQLNQFLDRIIQSASDLHLQIQRPDARAADEAKSIVKTFSSATSQPLSQLSSTKSSTSPAKQISTFSNIVKQQKTRDFDSDLGCSASSQARTLRNNASMESLIIDEGCGFENVRSWTEGHQPDAVQASRNKSENTKPEAIDFQKLGQCFSKRAIPQIDTQSACSFSSFEDDSRAEESNFNFERMRSQFEQGKVRLQYLVRRCADDLHAKNFFDLQNLKQVTAYLNCFKAMVGECVTEVVVSFAKM